MTASLQTKGKKVYVVLSWLQAGERKQKWITSSLSPGYGKRAGEAERLSVLREWEPIICINYTNISLGDYLRDWVERKKASIEDTTYLEYRRMVENTIAPYFDSERLSLTACKAIDIERFYRYRMKTDGVSANTISHHQACLYSALKDACRLELIASNPAEKVALPKVQKFTGTYCTVAEANELLNLSAGTRLEIPVYMAVWFGMRRGEIVGTRWQDIDFENRILKVRGVMSYCSKSEQNVSYRGRTKSEAGMRAFPLNDTHIQVFKHWKAVQASNRLLAGKQYHTEWEDFICVDAIGNIISPNYISWYFPKFIRENSFRKVRFHDLRHTNAVMLLSNGATMQDVQEWLGHENYSTTDEYYGGIMAETKRKTADILTSVLAQDRKSG